MEKRWCNACGSPFEPRPQSPRQAFCPKSECQGARQLLWQLAKGRTDADYHENQIVAQKAWRAKNREYWKNYRETHPEYAATNRAQQRRRNEKRATVLPPIAKSDASSSWPPPPGLFELTEINPTAQRKRRTWSVLLTPVNISIA